MTDAKTNLIGALRRLRKRARAVRSVSLTGRALLASAVALLALLVAREFMRERWGVEILPLSRLHLLLASVGALLLAVGAATAVPRFVGPSLVDTARGLDRSGETRDLLASGLAAVGRPGPVAAEVSRRAGDAAGRLDPVRVFPARKNVAKTLAVVPLVLAAVYLLGLPPGAGLLPLGGRAPVPGGDDPGRASVIPPVGPADPEPSPGEPDRPAEPEPAVEPVPGDRILARVVPAKEVYEANDPITIFVQAKPDGPLSRPHALSLSFVVDGEEADLPGVLSVGPNEDDGAVATVFARSVPAFAAKLGPGKHRVAAVLREGGVEIRTDEVEIEIRGDPGGASQPKPEPKPEPGAGEPPPPEVRVRPKFVTPLFGPGETREKEGWALVPDPDAPPGTPPRRIPIEEAAREAGRRAESAVGVESPAPADRDLVRRYFDALREGR